MSVIFAKEFFELQIRCAERVRALTGDTLEETLLQHTNVYVRLGCGRDFNTHCPRWIAYVDGLRRGESVLDWTFRFYLRDAERNTAPVTIASFGCFSYSVGQAAIRLHFRGTSLEEHSPLGLAAMPTRRAELAKLFRHARARVPQDSPVRGRSWLYNVQAYRRLFPSSYAHSTRRVDHPNFRSMHLWGQFVDRKGQLKRAAARQFLDHIQSISTLDEMRACLPLWPRQAEAPLSDFLRCYRVSDLD